MVDTPVVARLFEQFVGSRWFVLAPADLSLVDGVAVAFGVVWALVNFYHLYPYVHLFVVPWLLRQPRPSLYSGDASHLPRDELPTVDVLLPAYEEGDVIHQSIGSLRSTNYPQSKLHVNVLVEPDDTNTREALDDLAEEYDFREIVIDDEYEEIVVPDDYPGLPNKPRALNYGFELTDGDVVGIIDAEDIVDPDLFLAVAGALVVDGHDYVQGILDMVNEDDGWKNTLFRGEYAWWFRLLLPAFAHANYPVPLGGTTNFFRRSVLEEISDRRYRVYGSPWRASTEAWFRERGLEGWIPWDPRNVTEDFELGIFLWQEGYELGLLDVATREESPLTIDAWVRQRTRWQKGKLYTFLQYLRVPPRGLLTKFHGYFQSMLPHLAPINIAGIVILLLFANLTRQGLHPMVWVVLSLGMAFVVESMTFQAYSYWSASDSPLPVRLRRVVLNFVTVLPYWMLLWGAEIRAMKQLYGNDLGWEKTPHHGRNGDE